MTFQSRTYSIPALVYSSHSVCFLTRTLSWRAESGYNFCVACAGDHHSQGEPFPFRASTGSPHRQYQFHRSHDLGGSDGHSFEGLVSIQTFHIVKLCADLARCSRDDLILRSQIRLQTQNFRIQLRRVLGTLRALD